MNYNSLPQGVRLAVEAAQNKKAAAISVLDLSVEWVRLLPYFVICTGFSTPQVQAICTEIEEQLYKELGRSPEHRMEAARLVGMGIARFWVGVSSSTYSASRRGATTTSNGYGARRQNWKFRTNRKEHPAMAPSTGREMWRWAVRVLPAKRFQNDIGAAAVDLGGPGVAKCS